MPENYHINPKTGRSNKCSAGARPCPVGGPGEHYPSREAAREASEKEQAASALPQAVGKSPSPKLAPLPVGELVERAGELARSLRKASGDLHFLLEAVVESPPSSAQGREWRRQLQEVTAEAEAWQEEAAELRGRLEEQEPAFQRLREIDPAAFHGNKLRLAEVFLREGVEHLPHSGSHHSVNIGLLNPAQGVGSARGKLPPGRSSLVVLARRDGSRARVIASGGELYPDESAPLGALAVHSKEQGEPWEERQPAYTYDLFVLGYRDASGESHGWLPDKQVPAFRYL